jgi:hypothetical protein
MGTKRNTEAFVRADGAWGIDIIGLSQESASSGRPAGVQNLNLFSYIRPAAVRPFPLPSWLVALSQVKFDAD